MKALILVVAAGCVYDANQLCGDNMAYDTSLEACVCAANAVVDGLGCKACAPDEVVVAGGCGCAPGSAKNADGACARIAGLGDTCGSASDCTNPDYAYCADSTCTNTCVDNTGCGDAYTCATWEQQPYCRQFSGVGMTCTSSADCAGTDAQYCDTYQSHTCIVSGCSLTASDCPRGTLCCDFSQYGFGTLCAAACL